MDELRASVGDSQLVNRATQIAVPHIWKLLEGSGPLVWGRYVGTSEYAVAVDMQAPRYRCTCPTATQPCKHSLALHMIAVQHPGRVADGTPPSTLAAWLQEADPPAPAVKRRTPPSEEARLKREAAITAGVDELEIWLADQVRNGVASLPGRAYEAVDNPARRLVDAKAPGLAGAVRAVGELAATGAGWQERVVGRMGRLHLLLEAWRRRDALDEALRADVTALAGMPVQQQDVLDRPAVEDVWDVVGEKITSVDDENRRTMRTWLRGRSTGRMALLLQFEYPGQSLDRGVFRVGHAYEASLCYYPGACPLRALVKTRGLRFPIQEFPGLESLADMHDVFVDALTRQPWLESVPVCLSEVTVESRGDAFWASDARGDEVALDVSSSDGWLLLALGGGGPLGLFGEWDGARLKAVSAWAEGTLVPLGEQP